jgi:Predicted xylanase/chitin deacetylase
VESILIKTTAKNLIYRVNHWKNKLTDQKNKLLILLYHRVLPEVRFNSRNTVITEKTFIRQIDILRKRYPIISLTDAINQCHTGQAKAKVQVVLTFDDGYWDNYEVAFPILRERGLPATFFLTTDYVGKNEPVWDWEVFTLVMRDCTDTHSIEIENKLLEQRMHEPRLSFAVRVIDSMKSITVDKIQEVTGFLRKHSTNKLTDIRQDCGISWEQAKRMSVCGMEIGAHGVTHRSLSRLPLEEAKQEIDRSKSIIENQIGKPCVHFAFPFGGHNDCAYGLIDHFKKTGFQSCLLNIRGYNHVKQDSFYFKRIVTNEWSSLDHLLG